LGLTYAFLYFLLVHVSFCFQLLRIAGTFEGTEFDVPFESAEQTPGDLVEMKLWDISSPLPPKCVTQDPSLPYCQIWGHYRIDLSDSINTKTPHERMNEKCPTKAPLFEKPSVCWDIKCNYYKCAVYLFFTNLTRSKQ
jgi:hypothetical protein